MNNAVEEIYKSIDATLKQEADAASFMVGILEATVEDSSRNEDIKLYANDILAQLFIHFPVMLNLKLLKEN